MGKGIRSALVVLALLAGSFGTARAAAPFDITVSGPATYYPGHALSGPFSGALSVAGVGVPYQTVELRVDGLLVATASTSVTGTYAFSLPPFTTLTDRAVSAVAFGGTPLETTAQMLVLVERRTLSVSVAGNGTVTSSPAGISCPTACSVDFPATSTVSLSAAPSAGNLFTGWSGACLGTGACSVTLNDDTSVAASFIVDTRTLNVSRNGAGTVTSTPAGINCGTDCTEAYPVGTLVTLTALTPSGWQFSGWAGDCSGSGSCVVNMSANRSVLANFTQIYYTLTVNITGAGWGTVTGGSPSTPTFNCSSTCNASFPSGVTATLTANAAIFHSFAGWSGPCSGTGSCSVVMTSNMSVGAQFT